MLAPSLLRRSVAPPKGVPAAFEQLGSGLAARRRPVWLFDLDNTLHDASRAVFGRLNGSMTDYIETHLALPRPEADRLRVHYWHRYGATLLGLERHHGIRAAHFLEHTHALPGLEAQLHTPRVDRRALMRLPGRKILLTNAPLDYARRVLTALGLAGCFEAIVAIEHMRVFKHLRPKPDARMVRVVLARLKLPASRCVLIEDTLENLRAVRPLGMGTVWMQRYSRQPASGTAAPTAAGRRYHGRPSYVCARIRRLKSLHAWGA